MGSVGIAEVSSPLQGYTLAGLRPAGAREILGLHETGGNLDELAIDTVSVEQLTAEEQGYELGDTIEVEFGPGPVASLRIVAFHQDVLALHAELLVVPEVFTRYVPAYGGDGNAWIAIAPGFSADAATEAIEGVLHGLPDVRILEYRAPSTALPGRGEGLWQQSQRDLILLGLTAIVTAVGAANGALLAARDRRREQALLRAVGASRGQLASTLRWELLVAAFGTATVAVIAALGAVYVLVQIDPELHTFSVPMGRLAASVVAAVALVVGSAELPARWLARRSVIDGLTETSNAG
jgi:putative ABC transport system permease protein